MPTPLALHRPDDSPPLPQTRLLAWEYVFDDETAAQVQAAEEVASLLEVYLYWREDLARLLASHGQHN